MSKKAKTAIVIVTTLIFILLILAIFFDYKNKDTSSDNITEINILISLGGDNTHRDVFERYVRKFNNKNHNFRLVPYYVASDVEAMLKLIYATHANQKYHIACLSANQIYSLNEQNLIEPMDQYIEEDFGMEWMEQLAPVTMAHATLEGRIWSIPFLRNARIVLFNNNKAGYHKDVITINELLEYSEQEFTQSQEKMLRIPLNIMREYIAYHDPYDNKALATQGKYLKIFNNDNLQFITRIRAGVLQGEIDYYRESKFENEKGLAEEEIGMLVTSTLSMEYISNNVDFPISMAPLMLKEDVTFPLVTTNLYLVKQSNPLEYSQTWEVIKALWDIITAEEELLHKDHLPLTKKQINHIREREDGSLFCKAAAMDYNGYSGLAVSQKTKIDLQVESVLTSIMEQELDMKQELRNLQQRIDTMLQE